MQYRCMSCMEEFDGNVCPKCGYVRGTKAAEPHHMAPETILNKRYIVGKVLGFGGFGITYIAWDAMLNQKVAIKEYLPSEFATRIPGSTEVSVYDGNTQELFKKGLRSFIDEAQRLAKFSSDDGIVKIFDTFTANNTAYIIMEYLEGETVASILKRRGALPYQETLDIIAPTLRALSSIHMMGIIHRDVSPDNIFITKDGKVKVIDLGAARYASAYNSKSLSVILKRGYAPPEQYMKNGQQGPWTDNYATAATMYKMLTGKTPTESIDRKDKPLATPSSMGVMIPPRSENGLMNALNLNPGARPQTAQDLLYSLVSGAERTEEKKEKDKTKFPLWLKIASISVAALVLVVGILFATGVVKIANGRLIFPYGSVEKGYVRVPDVLGESKETAQEKLNDKKLNMLITGKKEMEEVEKDLVCDQDPVGGDKAKEKSDVGVIISSGPRVAYVPGTLFHTKDAAIESMEAEGFKVKVEKEYSDEVGKDGVISQSEEENSELKYKEKITIIVSKGSKEKTDGQVEIGDLTNKDFEETRKDLLGKGVYLLAEASEYNNEVKEDAIISQQTEKGTKINKGETVFVTVSKGKEKVRIPDLQYMTKEEATAVLEDLGLKVKTKTGNDQTVENDRVIAQEKPKGELVLKGSEFTITINVRSSDKKIPAILPSEAVNIYMKNKDVWMKKDKYTVSQSYTFFDVNGDGVLELIMNHYDGGNGGFTYNEYYEIDLASKKVKEMNADERLENGGVDILSENTKLMKNNADGKFFYLVPNYTRLSFGEYNDTENRVFIKDGMLIWEGLFSHYHIGEESVMADADKDEYSYYSNGDWVEISKSEYDTMVEKFNSENTDLHLKWKSVSHDDLAGASTSEQKEMLYEAYKAFSYDGYVFYDEKPKQEAPKEEPKPATKDYKIVKSANIGEVNGVAYATRNQTESPGGADIPGCKLLPVENPDNNPIGSFCYYDGYVYYTLSQHGSIDYMTWLYRCKPDWSGTELIAEDLMGPREFFIEDGILYFGSSSFTLPDLKEPSNSMRAPSNADVIYNDMFEFNVGIGGVDYSDGSTEKHLDNINGNFDSGYACGYFYYSKMTSSGGAILYRYNLKTDKVEEVCEKAAIGGSYGTYFNW